MSAFFMEFKVGLPTGNAAAAQADKALSRLRRLFPEIALRLTPSDQAGAALHGGAIDCAFLPEPDPALDWIPLAGSRLFFRTGDRRFLELRRLFVFPVTLVGAGPGDAGLCTVAGVEALRRCDVCLHDTHVAPELLQEVPVTGQIISVGKKAGQTRITQDLIGQMLADYSRQGCRVVRLKSGDPGIYGRLAEELDALNRWELPYRVLPGVSALQAATTGTGFLPTRRGIAQGFITLSPVGTDGIELPVDLSARERLPLAFFMCTRHIRRTVASLRQEGWPRQTPCALVWDAGTASESVECAKLEDLAHQPPQPQPERRGLLLVGETAAPAHALRHWGALRGLRVLLALQATRPADAAQQVHDLGGRPVFLSRAEDKLPPFDAVIFASAAAVEAFLQTWSSESLKHKQIVPLNEPTAFALNHHSIPPLPLSPHELTLSAGLEALAIRQITSAMAAREKENAL